MDFMGRNKKKFGAKRGKKKKKEKRELKKKKKGENELLEGKKRKSQSINQSIKPNHEKVDEKKSELRVSSATAARH